MTRLVWPTSHPGTCRHCLLRREVFSIQKQGGGSYKRRSRWYRSSICGQCAVALLAYAGTHAGASQHGFGASSLLDIVEVVDPEAAARYRARRDEARAAEEARRAEARRLS